MHTSSMACAIQNSDSTAPGQLQSLQFDNADWVETNHRKFLYLVQLIKSILALCLQENHRHKQLSELKSLNSQVEPNDLLNNTKKQTSHFNVTFSADEWQPSTQPRMFMWYQKHQLYEPIHNAAVWNRRLCRNTKLSIVHIAQLYYSMYPHYLQKAERN